MKIRIKDLFPCRGVPLTRSRVLPALIAGLGLIMAGRVKAQIFTNLHNFAGVGDGANPGGGLIMSGNTLYGTANAGGSIFGRGTVFKVNTIGTGFTTLHIFTGGSDGAYPVAGLLLSGNILYGTAVSGGASFHGTVFKVNTDATGFTNLYSFTAFSNSTNSDGAGPYGNLILSGNTLYGTASGGGGSGNGTVFAVNTNSTGFTNLHSFTAGSGSFPIVTNSDGAFPEAGLILWGNTLYGTTYSGGSSGNGTVFSVSTDGTDFTNLYSFAPLSNSTNSDGAYPYAGLVLLGNTLYGTANGGGSSGRGTVFAVNTDGTGFTNLYSFTGGSDGANPQAGLSLSGNTLYGTARAGGSSGQGTVFAVNADGTGFTNLHSFTGYPAPYITNSDGANPVAGFILFGNTLYGTASAGGSSGYGTVFSLSLGSVSTPTPTLNIFPSGAEFILTWPTNAAGFTLQSAAAVTDTFTNIPGATSPYSNHITGAQQFFRLISN